MSEFDPEVVAVRQLRNEMDTTIKTIDVIIEKAKAALQPLVDIANAYDANGLDDEARRTWGKNDEHENKTPPDDLELYAGRGGKRLLTLGDCFRAREAVGGRIIDLRGEAVTKRPPCEADFEDLLQEAMGAWGQILDGEEIRDHTAVVNWLVDWLPRVKEVLG